MFQLLSGARPLRPPLGNTSAPRDAEPESDDVELVLKWQEERIKRKLAGEYESAVVRIAELINGNLDHPARISAVRVLGAQRTRPSFLQSLINPHLGDTTHNTFGDALSTTRAICDSLARTGAFTSVRPTLALAISPLAKPGDLDVLLNVTEEKKWKLESRTEAGNGEASASATGRMRHVFGAGETLEASISFGTKTRNSFTASFVKPIVTGKVMNTRMEVQAYGWHRDNEGWASSSEELEGVKAGIRVSMTPANRTGSDGLQRDTSWGTHEFAYELARRHICGLLPSASLR